jgi:hypothetical protein
VSTCLRSVLCVVAVAGLLLACGGPTAEEAARDFLPVYCEKIKECAPATFAASFKDVPECVEKGVTGIPEGDRDKRSACGDDEIGTCKNDIKAANCDSIRSFDTSKLPASCQGC